MGHIMPRMAWQGVGAERGSGGAGAAAPLQPDEGAPFTELRPRDKQPRVIATLA